MKYNPNCVMVCMQNTPNCNLTGSACKERRMEFLRPQNQASEERPTVLLTENSHDDHSSERC